MDVTPMSLQAIVPRTSEATQVQHNMNQQSAVQQDFQAVRDKQETALKQTQVRKKDQAEEERIKDDPDRRKKQGRGRRGSGGGRHADQEEEAPTERFAVDVFRGRNIDIST
jgi:hypothetical protein